MLASEPATTSAPHHTNQEASIP
ncbi:uncharacterized protein G2W53_036296 [Senna tora]|uniref:Uncharacterized protein n=1 Tax=Senna tora TaxID=362788 RepID=A0A834W5U2_9FABA|nr:uncharacterized protein G2W53_036296 [Senna tora]